MTKFLFVVFLFLTTSTHVQADAWSSVVTLNAKGSLNPALALDPNGNAICLWEFFEGKSNTIQTSQCTVNGQWSTPFTLSTDNVIAKDPAIYFTPNGDALAFWTAKKSSGMEIQYATFSKENNTWIYDQPLATSKDHLTTPYIAFDAKGNGLAVWTEVSENAIIKTARLPSGKSTWIPLEDLAQTNGAVSINLAFDPAGNALMTWDHYTDGSGVNSEILSAQLSADAQSWTIFETIFDEHFGPLYSDLVFDDKGHVVIMWNEGTDIQASTYTFGDTAWKATTFPKASSFGEASMALDQKNNSAVILWVDVGTKCAVYCSTLSLSESIWSQPITLLEATKHFISDQNIQFDSQGNGVAIWTDSTKNQLQAVTRPNGKDWTPPVALAPFVRHDMFPRWSGESQLAIASNACVVAFPQWINKSENGIQAIKAVNLFQKIKKKSRSR